MNPVTKSTMTTPTKMPPVPDYITSIKDMDADDLENVMPFVYNIKKNFQLAHSAFSGKMEPIEGIDSNILIINPKLDRAIKNFKNTYSVYEDLEEFMNEADDLVTDAAGVLLGNIPNLSNPPLAKHVKGMFINITQETLIAIAVDMCLKRWEVVGKED